MAREILREQQSGTDPIALGEKVGDLLLHRGANKILEDVYGETQARYRLSHDGVAHQCEPEQIQAKDPIVAKTPTRFDKPRPSSRRLPRAGIAG